MKCHTKPQGTINDEKGIFKILLMGNPNVGKSVIFSKLTGMDVMASNYTGTTVSYTKGNIKHEDKKGVIIDVPGTYSLEASSAAEEVAVKMLIEEAADVVICVLDATNLERNLYLAFQLTQYNIPIVYALNLSDVASKQGVCIDVDKLQEALEAPVIKTVAIRNEGIDTLLDKAWKVIGSASDKVEVTPQDQDVLWERAGEIAREVQITGVGERTFIEKLGKLCMQPFPGFPIATLVMALTLGLVVGGGKAIRGGLLLPLLNNYYVPFVEGLVARFLSEGIIRDILVGDYGVLIKAIEWPFALILPYVFLFYVALSFLEDSGYLPRLAVLVDRAFKKLGIQGGNIIPLMMGYGCAVPAILGTRAATSQKERIIVSAIVSLAVPCVAQTGAFIALLGAHSALVLVMVYMVSLIAIIIGGAVLNRMLPGKTSPMLLEIPNLLVPDRQSLFKKIFIRTRHFMVEAELPMILAIGIAAIVAESGILNNFAHYIEPFITGWLGLPKEATLGLILGIIRRELAVLPLIELNLTTAQLFVGSVVALFYLPCLSVLAVLIKEFNVKVGMLIALSTLVAAFLVGGIINQVIQLLSLLVG